MIFCLIIIGLFVSAKFAFTRLRRDSLDELKELREKDIKFLQKLYKNPTRFIHTVQFFVLIFTILFSYLSLLLIDDLELQFISFWPNEDVLVSWVVDIFVILASATVILAFGEIIPKALGLTYPERFVPFAAHLAVTFGRFFRPFIFVASWIGKIVLLPFKTKVMSEIDLIHSEEEIRMLVNRSHIGGAIDKVESDLIDNVFDFVTRMAKEVMIPRQEVVCLYTDDSFEENMRVIKESRHTRYPLCEEDKDHIIGLVHVKDIMEKETLAKKDLRLIRRDILVVPEVMKLSALLQYMRTQRIYQSVVVDEYGGTIGLVGLEDIVEELVGDIQGEHEEKREQIVDLGEGAYELDGTLLVDEVEECLNLELSDADEDTLGGFIFGLIGRTPEVGDSVQCHNYDFTVVEMQGYRIARVIARPLVSETEEAIPEIGENEDE